jgi:succinate dehydrogenase / fumarate reductase cytochrome b subunit
MDHTTNRFKDAARPKRPLLAWFDVRKRRSGSWAFALNRLTGIGLTVYLFLHLVILSILLGGEAGWDQFITLARSPLFLTMDVILLFGFLFHGLNGIRVALVGLGISAKQQQALFWVVAIISLILLVIAGILVFTI